MERDERNDEEVEKLERSIDSKVRLFVLKAREIENYLLVPRALSKFIRHKKHAGNQGGQEAAPSVEEVNRAMNDIAEQLKPLVIRTRVTHQLLSPVYAEREWDGGHVEDDVIAEQVEAAINAQRAELDRRQEMVKSQIQAVERGVCEQWDTCRMQMVPGEELLDRVCRLFGVRFHKKRDAVRLAAMLEPGEVPDELRGIIRDICGV